MLNMMKIRKILDTDFEEDFDVKGLLQFHFFTQKSVLFVLRYVPYIRILLPEFLREEKV